MATSKYAFFDDNGYLLSSGLFRADFTDTTSGDIVVWDSQLRHPSGSTWHADNMSAVVADSYEIGNDCKCLTSFVFPQHSIKKLYPFRAWRNETIPQEVLDDPVLYPLVSGILHDEVHDETSYHYVGGYSEAVPNSALTGYNGYLNSYIELSGLQNLDCEGADYWMLMTYSYDLNRNQDHTVLDNSIFHVPYTWDGGAYRILWCDKDLEGFEEPEWNTDFLNAVRANGAAFRDLTTNQMCRDIQNEFDYAWYRNINLSQVPLYPFQLTEDVNNYNYHYASDRSIIAHGLIAEGKMLDLPDKLRVANSFLARALNTGMVFENYVNPPSVLSGISLMDAWQRYEYELPEEITWGSNHVVYTREEWLNTYGSAYPCQPVALLIGKRGRGSYVTYSDAILWENSAWDEEFQGESLSGYLRIATTPNVNREINVILPHGYYTARTTFNKELNKLYEEIQND